MNPVACSNCLNHFCTECIRNWLRINPAQSCPLCKNYKEMRCVPLLRSILSKLRFKCSNFQHGCKEEISYDSLIRHHDNCGFRLETCPSLGCNKKMYRN